MHILRSTLASCKYSLQMFTTFVFVSAMPVDGYIPAEGIFGALCFHHSHQPWYSIIRPPRRAAIIEVLIVSMVMTYHALSALGIELPAGHRPDCHALPPPWFMYTP